MTPSPTNGFTRTLQDLDQRANFILIRGKKHNDFSMSNLKKLKSDGFGHLCKKKLENLVTNI